MATTTTNFGWDIPQSTDLVKDGATAIAALGQDIDTALVDLKGGTTGQVLAKASNTDLDYSWVAQDDSNAIQNAIVDAKGDLIAATANDTPARLAVGNNGETLVADSSTSTGLRYTNANQFNPVINSGFDIWARGTSFSGGSGTADYSADRWNIFRTGFTFSRQATSDTTNLPNIQYCIRVQRNSGQTTTLNSWLNNQFESVNSIPYAGKTITFSFYARAGANYSSAGSTLAAQVRSGTGTDQQVLNGLTGETNVIAQTPTLTTTWQRFSFSGTVPSNSTQLCIVFLFGGVGTAGTNDYYEITGVQIDIGSTALPYRKTGGTIQGELSACQRYFQIIADGTGQSISMIAAYSSTNAYSVYQSKVTMRTTPTIYQVSGTNYFLLLGNGLDNDTFDSVTSLDNGSSNAVRFSITSGISMTQGYSYWFQTNNASARLGLQAEL
jgi:hypothetical protein